MSMYSARSIQYIRLFNTCGCFFIRYSSTLGSTFAKNDSVQQRYNRSRTSSIQSKEEKSTSSNIIYQNSVILPTRASFYTGSPEYYETLYFFDDVYRWSCETEEREMLKELEKKERDYVMNAWFNDEFFKKLNKKHKKEKLNYHQKQALAQENVLNPLTLSSSIIKDDNPEAMEREKETTIYKDCWKSMDEFIQILGFQISIYQYISIVVKLNLLERLYLRTNPKNELLGQFLSGFKKDTDGWITSSTNRDESDQDDKKAQRNVEEKHKRSILDKNYRLLCSDHNSTLKIENESSPDVSMKDTIDHQATVTKIMSNQYQESNDELSRGMVLFEGKESYGLARRKTSTARVWLFPVIPSISPHLLPVTSPLHSGRGLEPGSILVNGKLLSDAFVRVRDIIQVLKPYEVTGTFGQYNAWCRVRGGGSSGKSQAIKVALARALSKIQPELKTTLDVVGDCLKSDPRRVERKKPGKKKARKSFTWVKR